MSDYYSSPYGYPSPYGSGNGPSPYGSGCHFEGVCWPLIIYLILAVPGIVATMFGSASLSQRIGATLVSGVFVLLWSWLLWELCRRCHQGVAWFLLFLPVIIALGIFIALIIASALVGKRDKKT